MRVLRLEEEEIIEAINAYLGTTQHNFDESSPSVYFVAEARPQGGIEALVPTDEATDVFTRLMDLEIDRALNQHLQTKRGFTERSLIYLVKTQRKGEVQALVMLPSKEESSAAGDIFDGVRMV